MHSLTRPGAMWRLACAGMAVLSCRAVVSVDAQSSESDTCDEITAAGLLPGDSFPDDSAVYTNNEVDAEVRGKYVSDTGSYFIWYSPTDPTEYTSETPDASLAECGGFWVISSYPIEDAFEDLVWYQTTNGANCEVTPALVSSDSWRRAVRDCSVDCVPSYTDEDVAVVCVATEDEGDDDTGGLSSKTVVALIVIGGVGFMVFMCLGALACCIKGKHTSEQAIMPPGELTDGSTIGGKAGQNLTPGLRAHPETEESSQHPRPEGWAPSYASNSQIPRGSRSGPSVRSIGYT